MIRKSNLILRLILMLSSTHLVAQSINKASLKIDAVGIFLGTAKHESFLIKDENYRYANTSFKAVLLWEIKQGERWDWEIVLEPGIYRVEHQLLNPFYITPASGPDFEQRRMKFTTPRTFHEYALNLGLQVRYRWNEKWSTPLLASLGPMYGTMQTERLSKGFAFSNILGIGISFQQKEWDWNLRCILRHTSNLEFIQPNSGHNSWGIEMGLIYHVQL
ncbi:acyloxyacyl hydrolase [Nonlabens xiamenensis]|uniref:acyloxyacyl hydrolase n=1 Tax=Nonlabens xiamenensis TaxID=2341043 RepID=UPI0013DE33BF|nr:acyloxyacyl hydrolase [Nonlabens xiamenensis]